MLKIYHDPLEDGYNLLDFVTQSLSYRYASVADCDFILHNRVVWGLEKKEISVCLQEIGGYYSGNQQVLVFLVADYEGRLQVPENVILFRTSMCKSNKGPREWPLPYIWSSYANAFEKITDASVPSIGFCGLMSKPRRKLISVFQKSREVNADFLLRTKFWAGSPHNEKVIQEFDENIQSNIYTLTPRGKGNFSMRFYQVLSAGRIPVLLNTDMELPFGDQIPWDKTVVIGQTEKECLELVMETFCSGRYLSLQDECRAIFEDYFSPKCYFDKVSISLKERYL
ncbi:MAG: exostosin family protein [Lunatimonas sp.]|uniref:exostosin domain-containing protein n=1 Tax=Lunatimonas sp. TaxID=2060141 RepID=UPI00263B86A7|nr:exostosin family protein [Lunatimonas sp.]MCC5938360.1 exostosin family protein [Lunatimonas sp.]